MSMFACAQTAVKSKKEEIASIVTPQTKKMKVEIWSDVMCPFCYIGKRKFEAALEQFKDKENIELVWKSFQLNADLKTDPSKNTIQHLAESKGWSMDYTRETVAYVTNMAKEVGLSYDFDKAVVANSFDAHRLIQMAKKEGRGDAAEERLFKAYFTEGKNTADHAILIAIGKEIGLNELEVKNMLASKDFSNEVLMDIAESEKIGVTGVPFFVFDRKYAVSGAQDSKVFADTLKKAYADFIKN
jgi:predicted DsbA family dithiol-disulfide isomerase